MYSHICWYVFVIHSETTDGSQGITAQGWRPFPDLVMLVPETWDEGKLSKHVVGKSSGEQNIVRIVSIVGFDKINTI